MSDFDNIIEERIQVVQNGDVINTIAATQWFAQHLYPGPGKWQLEPAPPEPVVISVPEAPL